MGDDLKTNKNSPEHYKGLPRLLYGVRWTQHLLSIIAEVLILLAFAMSGMDVSLGGVMASIPLLKVLWAAMFALGIDTAFALSWVRVRSYALKRQWIAFCSSLLLALAMSFIIFEPISVQLFQQTLNVSFNQALSSLGVNIVFLTYARSGVAVFLGAILAMTNVESEVSHKHEDTRSKRAFILWDKVLNRLAPIVSTVAVQPNQTEVTENLPAQLKAPTEQEAETRETPVQELSTPEQETTGNVISIRAIQEKRRQEIPVVNLGGLSTYEKVVKVLEQVPTISDRELAKLSDCAPATAKKHRERFRREQAAKPIESEE